MVQKQRWQANMQNHFEILLNFVLMMDTIVEK
jgi:hypothetical protein